MHTRSIFLNPPPVDSKEEDIARYAIDQEKRSVDFYLSFEKTFPEAWKRLHVKRLVMEEKSHLNELITTYPQFKNVIA